MFTLVFLFLTPRFPPSDSLRRYQNKKMEKSQLKSSEDREIEKKVELSQKSFHRLATAKARLSPMKSIQPPTEPVEFQFRTSSRKKGKSNATPTHSCSEDDTVRFPYNLRNWNKNEWHPQEVGIIL